MTLALNNAEAGQVNTEAARVYETFFVPALFEKWAAPVCEMAGLRPGDKVLDVACGSGVVARAARTRVGAEGQVTGLDLNPGMLAVAAEKAPDLHWKQGVAEDLPFSDGAFDAVISNFGLMFFTDRVKALQEMQRAVRKGGRAVVAVWDRSENSPGYDVMIALLERLFGAEAANALRAPFVLGDKRELETLLETAGWTGATIETHTGTARFASIADWVKTDVRGWTLADMIDADQFDTLLTAATTELARFAGPDGRVAFDAPAHIVTLAR